MATKQRKLPTIRRQYHSIVGLDSGLDYSSPSTMIAETYCPACEEVTFRDKVVAKAYGTEYFAQTDKTPLDGTVMLAKQYITNEEDEKFLVHTTKNVYVYNIVSNLMECITEGKVVENCEDVWTVNGNVTCAVDADARKGAYSIELTIPADFTTGVAAYENFSTKVLSTYDHLHFYIKSNVALIANDYVIRLAESNAGASTIIELDYMEGYSTDVLAQATYVTNDTTEFIEQQSASGADTSALGDVGGVEYRLSQSFQLTNFSTISAVEVKEQTGSGSPTGNWTLRIETDSSNKPSGILTNANASIVVAPPGTGNVVKGTFAVPFALLPSTTYWLVVQCDNQANDNFWRVNIKSAAGYANGKTDYSLDGVWQGWGLDYDMYFKVYAKSYLQSYSESTIKTQGSYSLKGVAAITDSLNKTLTRTVSPTIDLTDRLKVKFDIYASRIGSNIKIGIHDSGGTTTETTPNVLIANTWQSIEWDISAVANADKNAINSIIITIVNANADNTFYIDSLLGSVDSFVDFNIPAVAANTWTEVSVDKDFSALDDVLSVSLVVVNDKGAVTINIGDVMATIELTGDEDNNFVAAVVNDYYIFSNGIVPLLCWNMTDATVAELTGGEALACKAMQMIGERLCLYHLPDLPRRVKWTVVGGITPEAADWTGPGSGDTDLDSIFGEDVIQTAHKLGNYVVIYGEKTIAMQEYTGKTPDDPYAFYVRVAGTGTPSERGVCNLGDKHIMLGWDDVYIYKGGTDVQSIGDKVSRELFDLINPTYIHRSFVVYLDEQYEVRIYFPLIGSTTPNCYFTYSLSNGSWSRGSRSYMAFGAYKKITGADTWDTIATATTTWDELTIRWNDVSLEKLSPLSIYGDANGILYQDNETVLNLAGVPIDSWWDTKDFVVGEGYRRQTTSWMSLGFEATGDTITVYYSTDLGESWSAGVEFTLTDEWKVYRYDLNVNAPQIRFRFENDALSETFELRQVEVGYVGASDRGVV